MGGEVFIFKPVHTDRQTHTHTHTYTCMCTYIKTVFLNGQYLNFKAYTEPQLEL